ncbi:MAG: sugar phosphate isomerase/epimerase [Clostridia bacterium]|nr:sugar phosphate isomerase/epimerase [Clostridia bacterium]
MHRILCSTGALIGRPNGRNIRLLDDCLEKLTCDGFEFMMYSTWYDALPDILVYLHSLPAVFPTMHCEKGIGERVSRGGEELPEAYDIFRKNCEIAGEIGAGKLVLHLWSGIASDQHFERNLEACEKLMEIAAGYNVLLTVENVVCNCKDPMTRMMELIGAYPDLHFTYDTKMAQFHRQMDELYKPEQENIAARIAHLHINDFHGGYMDWSSLCTLPMGEGDIDFAPFLSFMKKNGYTGDFTIEATSFDESGVIHYDTLNRTFDRLRTVWNSIE